MLDMTSITQGLFVGLLGLVLGSFGTVLAARVAEGESVVFPGSACRSCGVAIRARDNIPLLGYLLLRGRCRSCNHRIDPAYPLIELTTCALVVSAWIIAGPAPLGFALAGLAVIGPPLFVIDIRQHRLPNVLTAAGAIWVLGCVIAAAALDHSAAPIYQSLISAAVCAGALLLLAIVSRGGMGLGDVKLAGVLGLTAGIAAWTTAASAMLWAFLLGGAIAAYLLFTGRAQRGTAVPFGPMLLAGTWIAVITGLNPATMLVVLR